MKKSNRKSSKKKEKSSFQKSQGVKNSEEKHCPHTVFCMQFPKAMIAVSKRSLQGHLKYLEHDADWQNWSRVPDAFNQYSNALMRHLLGDGEDSDLEHQVAVAWNALARLELLLREKDAKKKG